MKIFNYLLYVTFIVLLFIIILTNRYDIKGAGNGACYKLDKWTGKMWVIMGTRNREVNAPQNITIPKTKHSKSFRPDN